MKITFSWLEKNNACDEAVEPVHPKIDPKIEKILTDIHTEIEAEAAKMNESAYSIELQKLLHQRQEILNLITRQRMSETDVSMKIVKNNKPAGP